MSTPQLGSRELFPALRLDVYVNHAAISPLSRPVRAALDHAIARYEEDGAFAFPEFLAQRDRLRGKLAQLIAAEPSTIALLPNTSSGVVAVAMCFPWRAGDRIVLFDGEFPTNVTPWQRAAALHGLSITMQPRPRPEAPAEVLSALEATLRDGARLVAVSAVQFQTGLHMPLAEIGALCRRYGAAFFVDAIQACGIVPLDVVALDIDFLTCGSHKWLMGAEGCGFLHARAAPALQLRPHLAAWLSHEQALEFLFAGPGHLRYDRPFKAGPEMLEGGAMNALGFVALDASLDMLLALGVDAIAAHVQRYHDALEPALLARGFVSARSPASSARSGILSFRPPTGLDLPSLPARLRAEGLALAIPDGWVRFSPHWPNDLAEIPRLLQALDAVLDG